MFQNKQEIITTIIGGTALILFLGCLVISFVFAYQKKQNRYIREKKLMQSQFQEELLKTQIEIQEHTLKTISQEIHDNVGQVLSLAKLNLSTFENAENISDQNKINDTKQLVSKAINDLRDLSRSLYGDRITELGLQEATAYELKILQNTGQYQTDLKISGNVYKLDAQKEMVLFRIVQEALNNAVKHAKAKSIHVELIYEIPAFTLMICDDGIGFDYIALKPLQAGIGLKSMQNRAALIGGEFSLYSSDQNGTMITIQIKGQQLKV